MAKKVLLILGASAIVIGALLLTFSDIRGPEPELECAKDPRGPTSGFQVTSKNCAASIESYNKWREWYKFPPAMKAMRVGGVALIVVGVVSGIVGLVIKGKPATPKSVAARDFVETPTTPMS